MRKSLRPTSKVELAKDVSPSGITKLMICTAEEFLLFVQNWQTEGVTIVLIFTVSGSIPKEPPFALRSEGRIGSVDLNSQVFTFGRADGDTVMIINLKEWSQIGYAGDVSKKPAARVAGSFSLIP